jgi:curved DNA-binding protein CbpA
MEFKDLYKALQVDPSAEPEVIMAAYRRLALKYHPDTNPDEATIHRMQEINHAYQILSNPSKRKEYDTLRENATRDSQDKRILVHSADFLSSSPIWPEFSSPSKSSFIKDGYYHMTVVSGDEEDYNARVLYHLLPYKLGNFRLYFDAHVSNMSGFGAEYGVHFHVQPSQQYFDFYKFGINVDEMQDSNEAAVFSLYLSKNQQYQALVEFCQSDAIKSRKWNLNMALNKMVPRQSGGWSSLNRHMIDVKDNNITLGINGRTLTKIENSVLSDGYIGLYVFSELLRSYAEVRFSRFRLYSS